MEQQFGRPKYTGKYADAHNFLYVSNSAEPFCDEKILQMEKETRDSFFKEVGVVVESIKEKLEKTSVNA